MKFRFHPAALAEFRFAARYYRDRQSDLGLHFVESIEEAMSRIGKTPLRWPKFEDEVRRCLVRVFPYAVLYSVESEFVLIIAIMHCHREPLYWRGRLAT